MMTGEQAGELLRRADVFRLLACAFAAPTGGEANGVRESFAEISTSAGAGRDLLGRCMQAAAHAWRACSDATICQAYVHLFVPTGSVPLNETVYRDGRLTDRAIELADLRGFYHMFDFPCRDGGELADHMSLELGFLGWLLTKEAYACQHGLNVQARTIAFAVGLFLERHLTCARVLETRIMERGADTAYCAMARLLGVALALERRRRRPWGASRRAG